MSSTSSYSSSPSSSSFSSVSSASSASGVSAAAAPRRRGKSSRAAAAATVDDAVEKADGVCALRWGENTCWGCGCSPCCGDDGVEGEAAVECLACWVCCWPCSLCKLFASSVGQDCAVVNHIVPVVFCSCLCPFVVRHNVRLNGGHGKDGGEGWIGDICMPLLCGPCQFAQILREVPRSDWQWHRALGDIELFNDDVRVVV